MRRFSIRALRVYGAPCWHSYFYKLFTTKKGEAMINLEIYRGYIRGRYT